MSEKNKKYYGEEDKDQEAEYQNEDKGKQK